MVTPHSKITISTLPAISHAISWKKKTLSDGALDAKMAKYLRVRVREVS